MWWMLLLVGGVVCAVAGLAGLVLTLHIIGRKLRDLGAFGTGVKT